LVVAPSDQSAIARLLGDQAASESTDTRFRVISESLHIALAHPLTGVGFNRIFDSHSAVVQFFQAGGILALASFAFWGFCFGRLGTRLSRDPRVPEPSGQLAAAMVAGLMGWLITGILNPQISERFFYLPCGVLLGLGMALARLKLASEPAAGESDHRAGPGPPAAVVGLAPRRQWPNEPAAGASPHIICAVIGPGNSWVPNPAVDLVGARR
jgi:hypothetical protein